MTEAAQIDRERRLFAIGCYLRNTPLDQIDFERTMAALDQIDKEQRGDEQQDH